MKILAITFLFVMIVSCQKKEIIKNSPEDIEFAKNLAKDFYTDLSNNDTLKIYNYLDSRLDKKEFGTLLRERYKKFGVFNRIDINRTETEQVKFGDTFETEYKLEVVVHYEKVKCIETIGFTKDKPDKAELFSYHINQTIP